MALLEVDNLQTQFLTSAGTVKAVDGISYDVEEGETVLVDVRRKPGMASISRAFEAAGPRRNLHFDPTKVRAAICVAGGLCPGLNNVVREITLTLHNQYHVHRVYGIQGGWHGFCDKEYPPVVLTPESVDSVHHQGGSFLRSSRGGLDLHQVHKFLTKYQISLLVSPLLYF